MSQILTMFINLFAYSDGLQTNNPQLRDFDYARRITDIPTSKSRSEKHIISVQESQYVLTTQRALTTGASWTVSNPVGLTSRFTWSGVNPVLRVERTGGALATGSTIDVTRQATSNVVRLTFSVALATGVTAGDQIYVGPGSALNILNQGIFTVVASGALTVDVVSTDMVNETGVIVADPTDIYVFGPSPVRVGDFLKVSDTAFNYGNQGEYQITNVTSRFVEIQNTNVVPEGPITADVVVYDQLYKLTYIETDQKVNVFINGSSTPVAVEPIQDGECGLVGVYLVRGPAFSVQIQNVGLNAANITTFFAT